MTFSAALLEWFAESQRDLPWRSAPAGQRPVYPTWVSEVMLQQTQVTTVIPYFEAWMQRFPDIKSLAQASQDEVLKMWEGLGYYRRARLLHQAAQQLALESPPFRIPESYHELKKLAGLGEYTAAAIASLCFNEAVIAVDANVKRVASRLWALSQPTAKELHAPLQQQQPKDDAGRFNEALIELGALICTPKNPHCTDCPVQSFCLAHQQNTVAQYPVIKKKKAIPLLERYALVYIHNNHVWLEQRPKDAMLGGLWGFPLSDTPPAGETSSLVKHAYTHFKIHVTPVVINQLPKNTAASMIAFDNLNDYALSTLDHKIITVIKQEIIRHTTL